MEQLEELVLKIARALVGHPDQAKVNTIQGTNSIVLELSVSKEDLGKIIGKHGKNAIAMRTILNSAAGKIHKRVTLEILE